VLPVRQIKYYFQLCHDRYLFTLRRHERQIDLLPIAHPKNLRLAPRLRSLAAADCASGVLHRKEPLQEGFARKSPHEAEERSGYQALRCAGELVFNCGEGVGLNDYNNGACEGDLVSLGEGEPYFTVGDEEDKWWECGHMRKYLVVWTHM